MIKLPCRYDFAFTILDDTDNATVDTVKPFYTLLRNLGMRTTKSVWVFPPHQRSKFRGESIEDKRYLSFIKQLAEEGFEIALHSVGSGYFRRDEILKGIEIFREKIGYYPRIHVNHATNMDNLYWGDKRFSPLFGLLHRIIRYRRFCRYKGDVENSEYFWGDIAKKRIKYIRNYTFNRHINVLKCDPWFPYKERKKPLSNFWFSTSNAPSSKEFISLLSRRNIKKLIAEKGICIVSTHIAEGFVKNGEVIPECRDVLEFISRQNGWFVPVSTILDFLLEKKIMRNENMYISSFRKVILDIRWFLNRLQLV